mmetsp:Transcript_18857/g.48182  ORF Transcript_18857/g.48182 Transcript_18857/m.48182 type:complete len:203 (+) Transcript_18857:719-1327(+)
MDTNYIDEAGGLALAEAVRGSSGGILGGGYPPSSLGELGLSYNPMGNKGTDALMDAAQANPTIHELGLHQVPGVKGPTERRHKEEHLRLMKERHRVAHFLVVNRLVTNEGFSEELTHGEVSDHRRGHGGWHSHDGPPLSSPFAAAVKGLEAHHKEGLLALKHKSKEDLKAHSALAALTLEQRDTLATVVLAQVQHAVQKDEM